MIIGRYEFQISLLGNRCNLLNFNMIATPSKMNQTRAPSGYKLGWYIFSSLVFSNYRIFNTPVVLCDDQCTPLSQVDVEFLAFWEDEQFMCCPLYCRICGVTEWESLKVIGQVIRQSKDKSVFSFSFFSLLNAISSRGIRKAFIK